MNHHSSIDTPESSTLGYDAISRRAYELWEQEGRPDGNDLRHWLQAEQELAGSAPSMGAASAPSTDSNMPSIGSDVRPLQGTRAGAAAGREPKRGSTPPFSGNKSAPGNGNTQAAARRKPASAPVL